MSHANAVLSPRGRLLLARCVVEEGWPLRRAAERFGVSPPTAARWAKRYRDGGAAAMQDRSSRPRSCPHQLPARLERRIVGLRVSRRWGPARIGYRLGLNPATVGRVLARYGCPVLRFTDPATGTRIRTSRRQVLRYEHPAPGDLVHVDVKKLGRIPAGGGHRMLGRAKGIRNRPTKGCGYAYLHHALDDHSRLAYSEILDDEHKHTAAAFWTRAQAWFAAQGITVSRVLTDNGVPTAPRTGRSPSARTSCINAPAPTGPRPMERSNGSTGPCSKNGPTPVPTPARTSAPRPTPSSCTPTITTAATRTRRPLTSRPRHQPDGSVHLGPGETPPGAPVAPPRGRTHPAHRRGPVTHPDRGMSGWPRSGR